MAVKIRCKRLGRTNRPFFRIAVMDGRTRRDGPSIEDLGFYDTLAKTPEQQVRLNLERVKYWLGVGAQPSETMCSILKRLGLTQAPVVRAARPKKQDRKVRRNRGKATAKTGPAAKTGAKKKA